jgi:hypothetical protein
MRWILAHRRVRGRAARLGRGAACSYAPGVDGAQDTIRVRPAVEAPAELADARQDLEAAGATEAAGAKSSDPQPAG